MCDASPVSGGYGTITGAEATLAVRAQLGGEAEVGAWTVVELGRGRGNATTSLGVVRVTGTARVGGVPAPWSQIRKVFVPPSDVAGVDMGRSVEHWNYWRREPELMASGQLRLLPPGLAAPAAYLVDGDDRAVAVWMEDLGDLAAPAWPVTDLDRAAHGIGRLGGWFAGRPPAGRWLSTDLLGQWVRDLPGMTRPLLGPGGPGWGHPVARAIFPAGPGGPVARLIDDAAGQLAALAVPLHTFCHRDTGLDNLLLRTDPDQVVMFDWALAGVGPVGEDLGVLFASATRHAADQPMRLCRRLFDHYLAGLQSVGGAAVDLAAVNTAAVWRAALATAALRECIFAAFHIARAIEEPGSGEETLAALARDASTIEALADAALTDADP